MGSRFESPCDFLCFGLVGTGVLLPQKNDIDIFCGGGDQSELEGSNEKEEHTKTNF